MQQKSGFSKQNMNIVLEFTSKESAVGNRFQAVRKWCVTTRECHRRIFYKARKPKIEIWIHMECSLP